MPTQTRCRSAPIHTAAAARCTVVSSGPQTSDAVAGWARSPSDTTAAASPAQATGRQPRINATVTSHAAVSTSASTPARPPNNADPDGEEMPSTRLPPPAISTASPAEATIPPTALARAHDRGARMP
ncbi:hypothetical protein ACFQ0G_48895 [Streptomyces chiangmaiensis]